MKNHYARLGAIAARSLSVMNHKIAIAGILAASIAAASASSYSDTTVGTVNGNGVAFTAATGNSDSYTTFTNNLATAFANNSGGVLNFDSAAFNSAGIVGNGQTITLSYGVGGGSSLVLTLACGGSDGISRSSGTPNTSGGFFMAENGSGADRVFTPSVPLKTVSIFNLNRGDATRTAVLKVTFLDNTTLSTSGANGGGCYFHELSATGANYIKSFTIQNSNLNRYDDLAFIVPSVVPLNASAAASVANPVPWGNTNVLTASASGGTSPYTYQWQTDGGGATFTNIPSATSSTLAINTSNLTVMADYQYRVVVTDNASTKATSAPPVIVNSAVPNSAVNLSGTMSDVGTTTPTPGATDQYQLVSGGNNASGLNYYTDNSTPVGETFTTGTNSQGYILNSLSVLFAGGNNGSLANQNYTLSIYQISAHGGTAFPLAVITNYNFTVTYGHWMNWSFAPLTLASNTVYAYTIHVSGGFAGLATPSSQSSSWYPAGSACAIPAAGGTVTYAGGVASGNSGYNGVFDAGLLPRGASVLVNNPVASPNPAYALSPVVLRDSAITTGTYTYQWLTDDGTGANPPHYLTIPGATSTNVTVIPSDLHPGGADYTTNYYFVVNDTLGGNSATSSVVVLTVHAATVPQITGLTPTNVVTFAGDSRSYSVTEIGTVPITNQWQFNNGGGYVSLTAQTNTTLALSNLQTTNSGNYQILAANAAGSASNAVTLTVLPAPAAPVVSSQAYFNMVYTNHPWAYWRLNETNDPTAVGAPLYSAYDYSGHGFDPVYGSAVTVGNAGPQPPTYPSMDTNELAVQTIYNNANAHLTVPALNLAGNTNVTFMAWIKPNGPTPGFCGLLMNRGGADNGCGFGFTGTADQLGYTWNNNASSTWGWNSGLSVAENQWNFVAYVITPTNAVIYLGNLNGGTTNFLQATNNISHIAQTFAGGTILLGADAQNLVNGGFSGLITEASLFTNALTSAQVQQYFLGALTKAGSSTALASSSNPSGNLGSVSFTASITPSTASGSVIFLANGVPLSTNTLIGGSATSLSVTTLPRGTNVIQAIYSGDAKYLASTNTLNQVVTNHPPVAGNVSYARNAGIYSLRILVSDLLVNVTDADSDTISLVSTGTSTNGVIVSLSGTNFLNYNNMNNVNDQFSYTVTDGFGGTNTGLVSIVVSNVVTGQITGQFTSFTNNVANLTFHGIPNYSYITERSTNLTDWVDVVTNSAATNGVISVTDSFGDLGNVPPASAYYRLKWQP